MPLNKAKRKLGSSGLAAASWERSAACPCAAPAMTRQSPKRAVHPRTKAALPPKGEIAPAKRVRQRAAKRAHRRAALLPKGTMATQMIRASLSRSISSQRALSSANAGFSPFPELTRNQHSIHRFAPSTFYLRTSKQPPKTRNLDLNL